MKVFIWTGPLEEAGRLPEEPAALMLNNDEEVLVLTEAETSEIEHAEAYEVLDTAGDLPSGRFAVLNNIPVTEEGRSTFEQRFSSRARLIEAEPGFVAIRVLRPLNSDIYVILTMWENEQSFLNWQNSQAYKKAHESRDAKDSSERSAIFPRPSFVAMFKK